MLMLDSYSSALPGAHILAAAAASRSRTAPVARGGSRSQGPGELPAASPGCCRSSHFPQLRLFY